MFELNKKKLYNVQSYTVFCVYRILILLVTLQKETINIVDTVKTHLKLTN